MASGLCPHNLKWFREFTIIDVTCNCRQLNKPNSQSKIAILDSYSIGLPALTILNSYQNLI